MRIRKSDKKCNEYDKRYKLSMGGFLIDNVFVVEG